MFICYCCLREREMYILYSVCVWAGQVCNWHNFISMVLFMLIMLPVLWAGIIYTVHVCAKCHCWNWTSTQIYHHHGVCVQICSIFSFFFIWIVCVLYINHICMCTLGFNGFVYQTDVFMQDACWWMECARLTRTTAHVAITCCFVVSLFCPLFCYLPFVCTRLFRPACLETKLLLGRRPVWIFHETG